MSTLTAQRIGAQAPADNAPRDPYSDDGNLLLLLTVVWALVTGRPCPRWPLTDLPDHDLITFWADPDMEPTTTDDTEGTGH